jgi:hypothetical protein
MGGSSCLNDLLPQTTLASALQILKDGADDHGSAGERYAASGRISLCRLHGRTQLSGGSVVHPDMGDMASTTASKALVQYQLTGQTGQTAVVNGVKFSVPIRVENGQPFVPTVFPITVCK